MGVYCADVSCNFHGFLLSDSKFTTIDFPGAIETEPFSINSRGHIVGLYVDAGGTSHGFLLREGTYTTIDAPGSTFTSSEGINSRGDIVGRWSDSGGNARGYLLREGKFTTFDYPGAAVTNAFGINARGDIVGEWLDAGFENDHGYLLTGLVTKADTKTAQPQGASQRIPTAIVGREWRVGSKVLAGKRF